MAEAKPSTDLAKLQADQDAAAKAEAEKAEAEKAAAAKAEAEKATKGKRAPALRITAKVNGFRRCGLAHPAAPVEHKAGAFTADQLEALKAEKNLVVETL